MTRRGRLNAEEISKQLDNSQEGNDGWWRNDCPICHAKGRPLVFKDFPGGVLYVHCHGGCSEEDLRAMLADRGITVAPMPCTVETMAARLQIPEDFLRQLGWKNSPEYDGSVRIPYFDADGKPVASRYRIALGGSDRFRWQKGSQTCLYGLHRLRDRALGHPIIVEGETDTVTLLWEQRRAVGLPGNINWDDSRDAGHFDQEEKIYVVIEPGESGEGMLNWLRKSKIRDRAWMVRMPKGSKDPAALYQADTVNFAETFDTCLDNATPWAAYAETSQVEFKFGVREKAARLLACPDILSEVVSQAKALGVTGEEPLIKLSYLAFTSRILNRPVSLIIQGPSAAGKSFVVKTAAKLFPGDTSYLAFTAVSEKALIYSDAPLQHRMLVFYEAVGLNGEFLAYVIRSLLSEGHVAYMVTVKDKDGRFRAQLIIREGPTGLIMTTTEDIHPENATRCLELHADDSTEQTARVMAELGERIAIGIPEQPDLSEWHAYQQYLAMSDSDTIVPYGRQLGRLIKPVSIRLRRDFTTVTALVSTHALLHQQHRQRDNSGRVIATMEDYEVIHPLIDDVLSETTEVKVAKPIQRVWGAVQKLLEANRDRRQRARDVHWHARREGRASVRFEDDPDVSPDADLGRSVTILEIAKALNVDRTVAQRYTRKAIDQGYLRDVGTGKEIRVELGNPVMSGTVRLFPTAAELVDEIHLGDLSAEMRVALGLEAPPEEPEEEEAPAGDGC